MTTLDVLTKEERAALVSYNLEGITHAMGPFRQLACVSVADWARLKGEIGKSVSRIDRLMEKSA